MKVGTSIMSMQIFLTKKHRTHSEVSKLLNLGVKGGEKSFFEVINRGVDIAIKGAAEFSDLSSFRSRKYLHFFLTIDNTRHLNIKLYMRE